MSNKIAINFNHDSNLMGTMEPHLANVNMEINYLLESIITTDEELYKEKWGHSLIHTERDRIVKYMAEYLTKPLKTALMTTYIYDSTPESMHAILEDIRGKVDTDEIIANVEVDFQGLGFECAVLKDGVLENITMTADELIDSSALEFMQTKLRIVYKSVVKQMLNTIEDTIRYSGCEHARRPNAKTTAFYDDGNVRMYSF